jgi:dihydrofolate reductase
VISLVAAIDKNRAIGYQNQLLARLPNDMKHFKQITTSGNHNIVLMGRKTFESIGKPLKDRINIVLTKNKNFQAPKGVFVYHSVEEILNQYKNYGECKPDLFIIGGQQIYNQFLRYADRIYLTIIDHTFEKADAYFPEIDLNEWKIISNIKNAADENNPYDHYFVTYERK